MKQGQGKTRRQRAADDARSSKPACGTLSYIAECRGALRRGGAAPQREAAADSVNRIVRKYSAAP